jgi:hypothetical protein
VVDKLEIVEGKLSNPLGLSTIGLLGLSEVIEILMIGENLNNMLGRHQVVSPLCEGEDDGV